MQHFDDLVVDEGPRISGPATDQSRNDPVGDLGNHNAEDDKDEGLEARVVGDPIQRTELGQESL